MDISLDTPTPTRDDDSQPQHNTTKSKSHSFLANTAKTVKHHLTSHVGAGLVASVAYFDPGNWSVDLQAGSEYGYKLLVVVLLSGLGAVVLQAMSTKLGCVTGMDLAQHCRLLFHDRPKHTKLWRWLVLYPLYALSEFAIIATDLAELIGSAIALVLLVPSLPLYAAVLITAADVFVILLLSDPRSSNRPVKFFEGLIVTLVMVVFISFIVLIVKVKPHWGPVMMGFLPSKVLVQSNALYTGIGILGATVMPHALFLGSSLAKQDRIGMEHDDTLPSPANQITSEKKTVRQHMRSIFIPTKLEPEPHDPSPPNRLAFIKAHLKHAIVDIVGSLIGFAVTINSAILILAGTVFFNATSGDSGSDPASLFDAYDLIASHLGKAAAVIFAVALLCAGQSAAVTATLAGQVISEGYISWKLSPFLTRSTTRLIALVPATIVAAVVGKEGINSLLVASQVSLSLVLPFVTLPLVYLTSNEKVMTVRGENKKDGEVATTVSYKNGRVLQLSGYFVFTVIILADVGAITTLILSSGQNSSEN